MPLRLGCCWSAFGHAFVEARIRWAYHAIAKHRGLRLDTAHKKREYEGSMACIGQRKGFSAILCDCIDMGFTPGSQGCTFELSTSMGRGKFAAVFWHLALGVLCVPILLKNCGSCRLSPRTGTFTASQQVAHALAKAFRFIDQGKVKFLASLEPN